MKTRFTAALLAVLSAVFLSAADGGVCVNSDAWQFWYKPAEKMTKEEVIADVDDFIRGGGVRAVFFNMNFQRTFFPTEVGTVIWKDVTFSDKGELLLRGKPMSGLHGRGGYAALVKNAKLLWERVPDLMTVRYRRCHEKGVEMWHSMRMNDVHYAMGWYEHRPQHSDLWIDHAPELTRAWHRHWRMWNWGDNTFDYGQPKVREYHLGIIREYLMNWESDGIELDWLRHMPFFKPGYDEVNTPVLTQFMRDVRKTADEAEKKWGHRIRIAVRVPWNVEDAMACGMDVSAWAGEKLVDIVIPSPEGTATYMQTQVALWRIVAPAPVILAPCIINDVPGLGGTMGRTLETDNGFASSFYQMGADTIYFYNHFPRAVDAKEGESQRQAFDAASDRGKAAASARRHILTRPNAIGEARFAAPVVPNAIAKNSSAGIRINAGDAVKGRKCRVSVGFRRAVKCDLWINCVKVPLLPV